MGNKKGFVTGVTESTSDPETDMYHIALEKSSPVFSDATDCSMKPSYYRNKSDKVNGFIVDNVSTVFAEKNRDFNAIVGTALSNECDLDVDNRDNANRFSIPSSFPKHVSSELNSPQYNADKDYSVVKCVDDPYFNRYLYQWQYGPMNNFLQWDTVRHDQEISQTENKHGLFQEAADKQHSSSKDRIDLPVQNQYFQDECPNESMALNINQSSMPSQKKEMPASESQMTTPKQDAVTFSTPNNMTNIVNEPRQPIDLSCSSLYKTLTEKFASPKKEFVKSPRLQSPQMQTPQAQGEDIEGCNTKNPKAQTPDVSTAKEQSSNVQSPEAQSPKAQSPKDENSKILSPKIESTKVQSPIDQSKKTSVTKELATTLKTLENTSLKNLEKKVATHIKTIDGLKSFKEDLKRLKGDVEKLENQFHTLNETNPEAMHKVSHDVMNPVEKKLDQEDVKTPGEQPKLMASVLGEKHPGSVPTTGTIQETPNSFNMRTGGNKIGNYLASFVPEKEYIGIRRSLRYVGILGPKPAGMSQTSEVTTPQASDVKTE